MPSKWIGWILTSAGLSGLLVAIGFIVDLSYQERIGYQFHEWQSIVKYLIFASDFLFSKISEIKEFFTQNISIIYILIIFSILILLMYILLVNFGQHINRSIIRRFKLKFQKIKWNFNSIVAYGKTVKHKFVYVSRRYLKSFVAQISALIMLIVLIFDVLILDATAFGIKNTLLKGFESARILDKEASYIDKKTAELWRYSICSKFSDTNYNKLRDKDVDCKLSREVYLKRLENLYFTNIILVLLYIIFTIIIVRIAKTSFASALLSILYILQAFNLLLLPYAYSKTIKPTVFDEAIVYVLDDKKSHLTAHKSSGYSVEHGFLLSKGKTNIVLFHKKELYIWIMPISKIEKIKLVRIGDVLEFYWKKVAGEEHEPYP